MRPRADRAQHLLGFGRGEDELHVRGRLFDELEQGVEALLGHHVRLVEDEDLEAVARRREDRAFAQVARVVDTVVARRVDLDDVERPATAATELDAAVALPARGVGGAFGAVQAAREDTGRSRLAAAARTREEVGVPHPVTAQGGHQRLGHLRLPDHLAKRLRAVSAVQGCRHSSSLRRATDIASAALPHPTPSPPAAPSSPEQGMPPTHANPPENALFSTHPLFSLHPLFSPHATHAPHTNAAAPRRAPPRVS